MFAVPDRSPLETDLQDVRHLPSRARDELQQFFQATKRWKTRKSNSWVGAVPPMPPKRSNGCRCGNSGVDSLNKRFGKEIRILKGYRPRLAGLLLRHLREVRLIAIEINAHPWRLDLDCALASGGARFRVHNEHRSGCPSSCKLDHMHWGFEMARRRGRGGRSNAERDVAFGDRAVSAPTTAAVARSWGPHDFGRDASTRRHRRGGLRRSLPQFKQAPAGRDSASLA